MGFRSEELSYVAFGGHVGLHSHGMFDQEVGLDFAEQKEGSDAGHQPCGVHAFMLCRRQKCDVKMPVLGFNSFG